jgi:hypothetical protein
MNLHSHVLSSISIVSFINSLQSDSVIPLGDNAGHVGGKPVGHHDQPNPPVVPREEDECKKKDDPVGEFSPTCFQNESFYICYIGVPQVSLPEATFEYGSSVWQKPLPFLDFEKRFIGLPAPFADPLPVEP